MKKITLFMVGFFLSVLISGNIFAQTPASVIWPCTPESRIDVNDDTSPSLAEATGDVTGLNQASGSVDFRIRSYSGSASGTSTTYQRWWPNDGNAAISWGDETDEVAGRYVEFALTPTDGNTFTLDSISMYLLGGGTSNMRANVYYSTDGFATRTKLNADTAGIELLQNSASDVMLYTYTPTAAVDAGQSLIVRVYPFYAGSPSTSKYIYFYNVGIYGTTKAIVVPVELTAFNAAGINNSVHINWSTASELNNSGWNIERKKEGEDWQKIAFVAGAGSKTEKSNYSYVDKVSEEGKYQYRLKQVDLDGSFTYSKIVEVNIDLGPVSFNLHQNYPNPFNPSTSIKFEIPEASFVNISVYNSIGQKVATLVNEKMERGIYTRSFKAANLTSGIYIYRLSANNNVITKKMMLLK